jgi:hypothetical protein
MNSPERDPAWTRDGMLRWTGSSQHSIHRGQSVCPRNQSPGNQNRPHGKAAVSQTGAIGPPSRPKAGTWRLLRQREQQPSSSVSGLLLGTSTGALIATVRLLRLPGDAEGGEGSAPDLARPPGESFAPPRSSSLALALLVDQSSRVRSSFCASTPCRLCVRWMPSASVSRVDRMRQRIPGWASREASGSGLIRANVTGEQSGGRDSEV